MTAAILQMKIFEVVQVAQRRFGPDYGSSHFDIRRSASSSLTTLP